MHPIIREKIGKRRQRFEEILPPMKHAKKVITYLVWRQ